MTGTPITPIDIRSATDADLDEIVSVCSSALRWTSPDFDRALFRWKHIDNAFGRSMLLVAVDESRPVGSKILAVRPFMRWRFRRPDGQTISAARAVDTATMPAAQGQGLFRKLTLAGLDELRTEGCGFVFNTPNDKSLAGYLKMGWNEAGGVGFGFGISSPQVARRLARSRIAASKVSIPTPDLGEPVAESLTSLSKLSDDVLGPAQPTGLHTDHTLHTLLWRFANGPIDYRFVPANRGGIILRLRQRGDVRELVVAHIIGPAGATGIRQQIKKAMKAVDADLCVTPTDVRTTLTVRRLGPTLAINPLSEHVESTDFAWSPGDIELM